MTDYNFWLFFLSAAFALNIAPGPDVLYILTNTISSGKKVGFASSLGLCTGALFHVVLAAFGVSAVLLTSAVAFSLVKYAGATYLLYLAYHAFRSSGVKLENVRQDEKPQTTVWKAYKQGILIDILNPKVAIFFMAFLPQFVRDGQGTVSVQLFYLGIIVILVAMLVEGAYVLLASKLSQKFREDEKYSIWLDRLVGTIFIGLGLKLATSNA